MDKIFQPIEGPTKIGMVKQFIENQRAKRLTCRICLELDHKLQMISPCACKGTSRYVHKSCLSKWRAIEGASRFRCEICHSHYEFCRSWLKAGTLFKLRIRFNPNWMLDCNPCIWIHNRFTFPMVSVLVRTNPFYFKTCCYSRDLFFVTLSRPFLWTRLDRSCMSLHFAVCESEKE